MNALEKEEGPDNPAVRDYRKLKEGAAETVRSIVIIINAMLKLCQTEGLKRIFSHDDLHLRDFATGVGGSVESPNLCGREGHRNIVCGADAQDDFPSTRKRNEP